MEGKGGEKKRGKATFCQGLTREGGGIDRREREAKEGPASHSDSSDWIERVPLPARKEVEEEEASLRGRALLHGL